MNKTWLRNRKLVVVLVLIHSLVLLVLASGIFLVYRGNKFALLRSDPLLRPKPDPSDIKSVIDANNQFALDYYFQLKSRVNGNIFFSPLSISSAFAMLYEGAKGKTAQEMRSVFYFPDDHSLRQNEYASIFHEINKKDKAYKLSIANAIWVQKDYPISSVFLDSIERNYSGKATNVDFEKNPEDARLTINKWVSSQTEGKIQDLVPFGTIDRFTNLVLTNAIYFKGQWVRQFDKNDTKEENFKTSDRKKVKVQMMCQTDKKAVFNYFENDDLQILEMPYAGDELSILFLLPKNEDLARLENLINTKNLSNWVENSREQRVDVYIPKFKFETKYLIAEDIKRMGMSTAFTTLADFSGMTATGKKELMVNEAIHQAFVEVNEEGTEAAASTAIMVGIGFALEPQEKPKIPVFRADHPFVFLIRQRSTGAILFIGRVANPNSDSN